MKKILLAILPLLAISYSYAQNTFPTSGNVGIGTTNPAYNLDVTGTIRSTSNVITPTVNNQYIGYDQAGGTSSLAIGTRVLNGANYTGYVNVAVEPTCYTHQI